MADWLEVRVVLAAVCVLAAATGCFLRREGWGWFLFVAVLVGPFGPA